jgi:hypothetical protein
MKASTTGVYGAGIENGKRKIKSEIQAAFGDSGFGGARGRAKPAKKIFFFK